jgi:hypothetical protein
VAAILAQVSGNAIGTRLDRDKRSPNGIGITPGSRVAKGRDVIDVNSEAQRRSSHAELAGKNRR